MLTNQGDQSHRPASESHLCFHPVDLATDFPWNSTLYFMHVFSFMALHSMKALRVGDLVFLLHPFPLPQQWLIKSNDKWKAHLFPLELGQRWKCPLLGITPPPGKRPHYIRLIDYLEHLEALQWQEQGEKHIQNTTENAHHLKHWL